MSVIIACYPELLSVMVIANHEIARKLELEELGFKWDEETKAWTYDFPATTKGEELTELAKKALEKVKKVEGVKIASVLCEVRGTVTHAIKVWKSE